MPARRGLFDLSVRLGAGVAVIAAAAFLPFGPSVARADFRPTPPLGNLTYQSTVTTLADGRVLEAGGRNLEQTPAFTDAAAIYDPWSNTWTPVSPMGNTRYAAAATLLGDGKVLVCGGSGRFADQYECERYDPARDLWLAAYSLMDSFLTPSMAPLPGGKALIFGASTTTGAEAYDPATNRWSRTANMFTRRPNSPAWTVLPDGRVFVIGGSATATFAEIYDANTNKWAVSVSGSVRQYPTATLLPSGKVLVAGGQNGSGAPLSSVQIYDPMADSWSNAAPMSIARASHSATLLPTGKVLVTGGVTSSGMAVNSAENYDPATDTWSPTPAMAAVNRAGHSSVALADGGALLVGGFDNANNLPDPELYQLPPATWVAAGSLATARSEHTATLLQNGKVLVAGGYDGLNMLTSAELFDPVAGSWSSAGNMLNAHANGTATLLSSGKVLVAAGNDLGGNVKDADLYDPATNSWSGGGTMLHLRAGATATLLNDGRVLVAGGSDGANVLQSTEIYDPGTNSWSAGPDMSTPRIVATATRLTDGRVLVAGGSDGTLDLPSAEVYDPVANTWTLVAPMNTPLEGAQSVLLSDGRVMVAGGELYAKLPNIGQVYDPVTNTWADTGPYDIGRRFDGLVIDSSGQAVLVAGSPVGGGALSSVELYDVATNQWWDDGELLRALGGATVTMLPSGRIIAAGGAQSGPVVAYTDESPAPKAVAVSNSGFSPKTARLHSMATQVHWTDTKGSHSVVERVKLGPPDQSGNPTPLFSSGTLGVGSTFGYTFVAAGTYMYKSNLDSSFYGKVTVPDYAFLASDGGPAHIYVAFAAGRMPGYAFNASFRYEPVGGSWGPWTDWSPPGSVEWVDAHGVFTNAQSGKYQFRSLLKNVDTGKVSGVSPPVTVSVP